MFSDIFKQLIQNANVTAYQMSKDTGISESLISNWKSGRQLPKYDSLNILADYFNVSGDYLLGRTNNNTQLNNTDTNERVVLPEGRENVDKSRIIPLYITPASAGTGSWLSDETPVEWITVPRNEKTSNADFILEIRGDSMQPHFFDGDKVLIKKSARITEGEIGVFILNNESYIKKMGRGELISLNPAYEPIKFKEYDDVRCVGKVIDTIIL